APAPAPGGLGAAPRGRILVVEGGYGTSGRRPWGRGGANQAPVLSAMLAAVSPQMLLAADAVDAVHLPGANDPQTVLAHLRAASRHPGPLLVHLGGHLVADKRGGQLYLTLRDSKPGSVRQDGLSWQAIAGELQHRPREWQTLVIADLSADQQAWPQLQTQISPLTDGIPLWAVVSPDPEQIGTFTRALIEALHGGRPGADAVLAPEQLRQQVYSVLRPDVVILSSHAPDRPVFRNTARRTEQAPVIDAVAYEGPRPAAVQTRPAGRRDAPVPPPAAGASPASGPPPAAGAVPSGPPPAPTARVRLDKPLPEQAGVPASTPRVLLDKPGSAPDPLGAASDASGAGTGPAAGPVVSLSKGDAAPVAPAGARPVTLRKRTTWTPEDAPATAGPGTDGPATDLSAADLPAGEAPAAPATVQAPEPAPRPAPEPPAAPVAARPAEAPPVVDEAPEPAARPVTLAKRGPGAVLLEALSAAAGQPLSEPVPESLPEPVSEPVSPSLPEPVSQPLPEPKPAPVSEPLSGPGPDTASPWAAVAVDPAATAQPTLTGLAVPPPEPAAAPQNSLWGNPAPEAAPAPPAGPAPTAAAPAGSAAGPESGSDAGSDAGPTAGPEAATEAVAEDRPPLPDDYREAIGRIVRSAEAGEHAAAAELALALEERTVEVHGPTAAPVLQVRQVRAHVSRLAGRPGEAADLYRAVALVLLRAQGADHPETQQAATNAEACWRAIPDRAEALKVAPEIIELRAYLPGPDGRKLRAAERYLAQLAASPAG
ncbi:hypothetical protein ACFRKE_33125, partial [Kitasatospora indigofera]